MKSNFTHARSVIVLVLPSNDDDCGLATHTDDGLPSSVTTRGDERWGSPYHPSWATDLAGPCRPACPGEPSHPRRGKPKWRFPLSFPRYVQERPEERGRRRDPPAKGPCHPQHTTVSWSGRARGGARERGGCPVSQMWQREDDRSCRKRFFSGQYNFLEKRKPPPFPSCPSVCELFPSRSFTFELWGLDTVFSVGWTHFPLAVILTRVLLFSVEGGSRSSCVNILVLNFQGQQTQSLVGWEEVNGEGKCRPPATNTIWEDRATRAPCVLQICPWAPPLHLWWWLFQANSYSGMELTLLDPTCKAKMNGTHFILESPLNGCGTRHRRSAPDGVVYYNSVSVLQNKAWPFARALLGVTLKLALKFLWPWAGACTPG